MRSEKIMLVFRKDWREVQRNWQVVLPVVVVPILFAVMLPVLTMLVPVSMETPASSLGGFENLINNLPDAVRAELAGMTEQQKAIYVMALYFFAPLFLIIPLMASSVISSDSFAGEKERKTIEALLATPISDSELFLGKVMVAFAPAMIITSAAFVIYASIVNLMASTVFGRLLLPNLTWLLLIFGVAPTVALAAIGLTVMISASVKGFREAQQISMILLIPILMLLFGQTAGAIVFGPAMVGALIGLFAVIDILVFYFGIRLFRREEILSRLA